MSSSVKLSDYCFRKGMTLEQYEEVCEELDSAAVAIFDYAEGACKPGCGMFFDYEGMIRESGVQLPLMLDDEEKVVYMEYLMVQLKQKGMEIWLEDGVLIYRI